MLRKNLTRYNLLKNLFISSEVLRLGVMLFHNKLIYLSFQLEWDPKKIKEEMKTKAKENDIPSSDEAVRQGQQIPTLQVI